jgi:hypothetical protein
MKNYSFFTDKFLDLKLTKKEIKERMYNNRKAKGYPEVDYYYEYKKLGGKKNRKKYFEILDIFLEETYDIYVDGNMEKHPTREDSLFEVIQQTGISNNELYRIFNSVDNVTAYT